MSISRKEVSQSELLNTQNSIEDEHTSKVQSSEQLAFYERIPNTPFTIVGTPVDGYFLSIGKHRLTDKVKTVDEVKELLITDKWLITFRMVCSLHEIIIQDFTKDDNLKYDNDLGSVQPEFPPVMKRPFYDSTEDENIIE